VSTPPEGISAEVVVVDNWQQLHALPPDTVKGKILLFNHKFDKDLAAQGDGLNAYVGGVVYRGAGPIAAAAVGAVAVLVRSVGGADFRPPAHRHDAIRSGGAEDSSGRSNSRGTPIC